MWDPWRSSSLLESPPLPQNSERYYFYYWLVFLFPCLFEFRERHVKEKRSFASLNTSNRCRIRIGTNIDYHIDSFSSSVTYILLKAVLRCWWVTHREKKAQMIRPTKSKQHVVVPWVSLDTETAQSGDENPPLSECDSSVQNATTGKKKNFSSPVPHVVLSNNHCYVHMGVLRDA